MRERESEREREREREKERKDSSKNKNKEFLKVTFLDKHFKIRKNKPTQTQEVFHSSNVATNTKTKFFQ